MLSAFGHCENGAVHLAPVPISSHWQSISVRLALEDVDYLLPSLLFCHVLIIIDWCRLFTLNLKVVLYFLSNFRQTNKGSDHLYRFILILSGNIDILRVDKKVPLKASTLC